MLNPEGMVSFSVIHLLLKMFFLSDKIKYIFSTNPSTISAAH